MSEDFLIFKFLLIGDSRVGKSSILTRFIDNVYTGSTITTIGADYKIKSLNIENKAVKLNIWDTAGEERFQAITSCYYRGCHGFLVVYDITNKDSFDHLKHWLQEIEKNTSHIKPKILIIGNKYDLNDKRAVDYKKAKEFCDSQGVLFIETSAKDSTNVENAFITMTTEIVKDVVVNHIEQNKDKVNLQAPPTTSTSGYCCYYI